MKKINDSWKVILKAWTKDSLLNTSSDYYSQISNNVYIISTEHNVPAAATCYFWTSNSKKYYTISIMEDNWQYMSPDMKLQQIRSLVCWKWKSVSLCECKKEIITSTNKCKF